MTFTNCTLLSQELREHILHMRREMTRQDRSSLPVRQRLAQRLTELLNQMPVVTADVGFRRVDKDAEPGDPCTHVCNREPNDWELSTFVIERLVAIGLPGQHQHQSGAQKGQECEDQAESTIPAPDTAETELEQLRDALAIANDRTAILERERDQARAELAALKTAGCEAPEVVATLEISDYEDNNSVYARLTKHIGIDVACADDRLMLVAQHERNLAALSSGHNPIAVISQPRSDADPDEGPFMEAHYWLRLRKLPGGTKLYTAPPLSLNLIRLLDACNPLSNAAYSLAQKPGHSLTTYDCELLAQLRTSWDAAVAACTQTDSALES